MGAVAEYFATLKLDTSGSLRKLDAFDAKAQGIGGKLKNVGRNLQAGLDKIRLPALAITGGGLALGGKLQSDASDLNEAVNAVNQVFKESAGSILDFGNRSAQAVGLSKTEFLDLAVTLQAQLKNAGLEGEALNKTLIDTVTRAADIGSLRNVKTPEVLTKITAALRGEADPIESLGVIINQNALQQEALASGIDKSVSKMTEQEKISLRLAGVFRQTSDAAGDFARTSEDVATQTKIQEAKTKDLSASMGRVLLPVMKSIQKVTGGLLDFFNGLSAETQDLITKIGLGITAFAGLALAAGFIAPLFGLIATGVAALASPIALAVAAIIGAGALIYAAWEPIKAFFSGFWSGLREGMAPVFEGIGRITNALAPIVSLFRSAFGGLIDLLTPVSDEFDGIKNAGHLMGKVVGKAITILFKPIEFLLELGERLVSIFTSITDVLPDFSSISKKFSALGEKVDGAFSKVKNFFGFADEVPTQAGTTADINGFVARTAPIGTNIQNANRTTTVNQEFNISGQNANEIAHRTADVMDATLQVAQ